VVALVVLVALIPASASADPGSLTPRLEALASKGLREASPAEQADAVSLLRSGPGSLSRVAGRLDVQIRTAGAPGGSLDAIRTAGADVIDISHELQTITALVREQDLRRVGAVPGVVSVEEVIAPMSGAGGARAGAGPATARANDTCATGIRVSEALTQLEADDARQLYDVDGGGVKVGVLSDSYDLRAAAATHASQDVASGDLPGAGNPCGRTTPVQVLDDDSIFSKADEGRAMLQAVHDVAPGAALAFATAENSDTSFADNIRALAGAGADVIADDYIYFNEPFYQDSVIAKAVSDVTAQGVAYFSMAFNNNRVINGADSNSWEAIQYRSTTCPSLVAALASPPADCMDFDAGSGSDSQFGITATGGPSFRFVLQWAQPWFGVSTDFNLYVINTATNSITASSTNVNATTQKPFELAAFTPGNTSPLNYQVVIGRMPGSAATPRIKWINSDNGAGAIAALEYATPTGSDRIGPTIYGHNGSVDAQTVGAVPFSNSSTVESFSSRGPVTHLFGPVVGTSPAAPLPAVRETSKPDVVATDAAQNTFFGTDFGGGLFRFSGTSQAAPHAAAIAALQLSAAPTLTAAQVKADQRNTADAIPGFGPLAAGSGLIDARAALIAGDHTQPSLTITKKPKKKSKSKQAKFEFATDANATLECSLDGKRNKPCATKATFTVKPGKHRLIVQATDPAGNLRAESYSWKYKKKKTGKR